MPPIFLMLVRNIICGCWWYGSRGWTFLSRFHYMLLLRYKWQQKGSLTKWCLTWKCLWSKVESLNSSMKNKLYPLTFIHICWTFMENKQRMWVQWSGRWCISAVMTVTVIHLRWCRFLSVWHAGSCSSLTEIQSAWWWLHWKTVFCIWEFAVSNTAIVFFVRVVVSMKTNRWHYFWSNIHLLFFIPKLACYSVS